MGCYWPHVTDVKDFKAQVPSGWRGWGAGGPIKSLNCAAKCDHHCNGLNLPELGIALMWVHFNGKEPWTVIRRQNLEMEIVNQSGWIRERKQTFRVYTATWIPSPQKEGPLLKLLSSLTRFFFSYIVLHTIRIWSSYQTCSHEVFWVLTVKVTSDVHTYCCRWPSICDLWPASEQMENFRAKPNTTLQL